MLLFEANFCKPNWLNGLAKATLPKLLDYAMPWHCRDSLACSAKQPIEILSCFLIYRTAFYMKGQREPMSASNEWTEWHLTPTGWQRGTEKEDFRRIDREPPVDRVLTVVHKEFISSRFSPMEKSSEIEWRSDDETTIATLTAKFGPAPQRL